jgi:hypothetical protein
VRYLPLAFALVALCSCSSGTWPRSPDATVADEIEAKLARVPCVGPISRWERHYSFASRPSAWAELLTFSKAGRWFDYNKVEIRYHQAGFEEFRSRRIIHRGAELMGIDDRDFDLVFGEYDIPNRTAVIWACGPNMSDDVPEDLNIVVR